MTEQENRIYALGLLNQAFPDTGAFDARDIAVLAKVIPLIEANIADWAKAQPPGIDRIASIRNGAARPRTQTEGNLK